MNGTMKNITAMLIFGSIGLFVRHIDLHSEQIALYRGFIGSITLIMAMFIMQKKISIHNWQKNLLPLLIAGLAIGFNWIFLFQAYTYTTIATATLTYYLAPTFVVILSPFILKEHLSKLKLICAIVSLLGMSLVAGIFSQDSIASNNLLGIFYGVLAAFFYAIVILSNKFIKNMPSLDCSITQLLLASLILLPYVTSQNFTWSMDLSSLTFLIILGCIHTGVAYLLYFASLQDLPAQKVAIFSYIDPVTAIILSTIVLSEAMNFTQWVGAILILGSLLYSEFKA